MMKGLARLSAAFLFVAGIASDAFAAHSPEASISTALKGVENSPPTNKDHTQVADGGFGVGLAVGIIGTLVVRDIKRYHGYYGYRPYASSCRYWHYRCSENWGYRNSDYYGCLRYHGC